MQPLYRTQHLHLKADARPAGSARSAGSCSILSLRNFSAAILAAILTVFGLNSPGFAQSFDFKKLSKKAQKYTVIVNATVSVSMGSEPFESKVRGLGIVVSDKGLVIVDAELIDFSSGLSSIYGGSSSFEVVRMNIQTLDGKKFPAKWIGSDRFSGVGFCQIESGDSFDHVTFRSRNDFKTGEWVALFFLLPDYVQPPLAADIGMITAVLTEPEASPLLVGFSETQTNSVIYDERGEAVGVLGAIANPSGGSDLSDPAAFLGNLGSSFSGYNLLGILTAERLNPLINDPPRSGQKNRGWLGVSFQALNKDIADYWGLDAKGGVILNEVVKSSPAALAGAEVGDIVLAVNGEPMNLDREESLVVFRRIISELGANAVVEFEILRRSADGAFEPQTLVVELGETPLSSAEAETHEDDRFEFKARNLVFNDFLNYNLDPDHFKGVWITEVNSGGWAALGGLRAGDIVQLINGVEINSVEKLRDELNRIRQREAGEVVFFVWRDNKTLFVNIKPNWDDES